MLILQMYERKTSFRPRESRDQGNPLKGFRELGPVPGVR